jgi:hypothetical protein
LTFYLIALNQPTDQMREAVHSKIKESVDVWWHELSDIWIVKGLTREQWSKAIQVAAGLGVEALVIALPPVSAGWGFVGGNNARSRWLYTQYSGMPRPPWEADPDAPLPASEEEPF